MQSLMGAPARLVLAGLAVGVITTASGAPAWADGPLAYAIVEFAPAAAGVTISASALSPAPLHVSGELAIERRGAAGTVTTHQSGDVELAAGAAGKLATTTVSMAPGDRLKVTLTLRAGSLLLAQTVAESGAP